MTHRTLAPCRILVVDDQDAVTYALHKIFSRSGHTVRVAHDAVEAAEVAFEFRPEIVIIGLWMPLVDGLSLGRAIRSANLGDAMQLVAITGLKREGNREAALSAGFDVFIEKPADLAQLEDLLASHLGH